MAPKCLSLVLSPVLGLWEDCRPPVLPMAVVSELPLPLVVTEPVNTRTLGTNEPMVLWKCEEL